MGAAETPLTLGALRRAGRELSDDGRGPFTLDIHPLLMERALDLPNFVPVNKYATGKPLCDAEVGVVEWFRVRITTDIAVGTWRVSRETVFENN